VKNESERGMATGEVDGGNAIRTGEGGRERWYL